jgi:hypothetical protein
MSEYVVFDALAEIGNFLRTYDTLMSMEETLDTAARSEAVALSEEESALGELLEMKGAVTAALDEAIDSVVRE